MYLGSKLYQRLLDAFNTCHPFNSKVPKSQIFFTSLSPQETNQANANELWLTVKVGKGGGGRSSFKKLDFLNILLHFF